MTKIGEPAMNTTHIRSIRSVRTRFGELCHRHTAKSHEHVTEHTWFDRLVLAVIIVNVGVLAWGLLDEDHEELIELADQAILVFFAVEIGLRLKSAGRKFYKDGWLWFDIVVVTVALLPLGADVIAMRIVRAARLAHFSRHLPHLRHLSVVRWIGWLLTKAASR